MEIWTAVWVSFNTYTWLPAHFGYKNLHWPWPGVTLATHRCKVEMDRHAQVDIHTSSLPLLLLLLRMLYLHRGHVALICSHLSIQPQWKWCPQGSSRSSAPSSYPERQIQHSWIDHVNNGFIQWIWLSYRLDDWFATKPMQIRLQKLTGEANIYINMTFYIVDSSWVQYRKKIVKYMKSSVIGQNICLSQWVWARWTKSSTRAWFVTSHWLL
jgi:hypothetical protein